MHNSSDYQTENSNKFFPILVLGSLYAVGYLAATDYYKPRKLSSLESKL